MAYLHCHSCDWSQDDFWTRRYNPITKFWDMVKWLWRPRTLEIDDWLVADLEEYTKVSVWRFKGASRGQVRVFSWDWLWLEFVKNWRLFRAQKWWTWKAWKKARGNAVCPECGEKDFDID